MIAMLRTTLVLLSAFAIAGLTGASAQTPSPTSAKVYFINLKDGAKVKSSFLQFDLTGMGVVPASRSRTPGIIICSSTPR